MSYLQEFLSSKNLGGPHGSHSMYWIPIGIFHELPIQRWKFNRPSDKDRVVEIHEFMKVSKRMDGIIYLAVVKNEFVCYESNHRREALQGLTDMADILVDILWNATDDNVKQEFLRLNKAVSVPELYIDNHVEVDIEDMRKRIDTFCQTYKSHKVASNRPQRPNFNRDNLTDDLYQIQKETKLSLNELFEKLHIYNSQLAMKDRSNLSQKVVEKCLSSGLWLFAWNTRLHTRDIFPS